MSPLKIRGTQVRGTQDLGTKKTESLRGGASQKSARGRGGLQAPRQGVLVSGSPPGRAGGLGAVAPQ